MNKQELNKAYTEGLITKEKYQEELFNIETTPKQKKKPKRIFEHVNDEDFKKLLKYTKKHEHRLAFVLGYGGGFRISEIVGGVRSDGTIMKKLQPEDINLKDHKIFIRQAKGRKDRITYAPKWFKQKDLKYFPLKLGKRALQYAFLNISKRAGINWEIGKNIRSGKEVPVYRYHFHCLRSSFITNLLNKGVPVNYVKLLVGHESLATTSSYAKGNPTDAIAQIMEKGL